MPTYANRWSIYDLGRSELAEWLKNNDQPTFRVKQLWDWLYAKRAASWSDMRNITAALQERLDQAFLLSPVTVLEATGHPNETRKLLLELADGEKIESVLIPARSRSAAGMERNRRTVCVSSQVGCKFACAFCASGQSGFRRDLTPGEMLGQVLSAAEVWGERPTHVVYMGIGEPFDNYDNVLKSVRVLNDADGLNIGARRITISTCGVVPGIIRLAEEGLQVELSVSLHAAQDSLRSTIMPVNQRHPLDTLLAACKSYAEKTGRIVTFEYTLVAGINDGQDDSELLARRLRGVPCRVNLIPLSPVEEFDGRPTSHDDAERFLDRLTRCGVHTTLRVSKGATVKAACGQLRASRARHKESNT